MPVVDQRDQRTPTIQLRPAKPRKPTKPTLPKVDRSIAASLARGAELRERMFRGELAPGPTPEHIARGMSHFFELWHGILIDLSEHEPSRAERWKKIASVLDDASVSALRCSRSRFHLPGALNFNG